MTYLPPIWGTYTPTVTGVTNIDSVTAYPTMYTRTGNIISVSGKIEIAPTVAGVVEVGISFPITANMLNDEDCVGYCIGTSVDYYSLYIKGDIANNRASVNGNMLTTSNREHYFQFTYIKT